MLVRWPAGCKSSHHFEFLASAGPLSLPCPLACPHLMDVKVRGKTPLLALFPLQDLSVAGPPWGKSTYVFGCGWGWEEVDTNCRPFDISISTAGCAVSHCEWKVALRRPEIRHAVGPLCPGSVLPLTQLPRGGCWAPRFPPCAGGTPPCRQRGAVNWHRCLPSATWPWAPLAAPWSQTPRKLFVFLTRKPPNSLLTGTSSPARSKTQGILRIALGWDQGWIRIKKSHQWSAG